ncbi:Man1-Src1p-C-terminal domain-containing protein [Cantharellus anzutake]|uniref:Man1-Src1p-C-terminal domain-containing protein n=1 Tax=Cantharellus anzutake TaxID=1750568 RepID=UPI0019070430|nr:Man1-Src1p-C-terminal domain-containing protein [Cantharellus anzutake]KAF8334267.1 Man1-Src1p-C-terminal domain-containing protein [Cantharellus anzutake]
MPASTADIIASAEYLEYDYNPRVLTVAQLMGILHHHQIRFPSNVKKDALLSLFNEHITGNLDQLRHDRDILDGSQASDAGITDGVTGELISERDAQTTARRRGRPKKAGSVRASAEPSTEPTRRSTRRSAEPTPSTAKPKPRKGTRATEPIVIEGSESEPDASPVRPVRASKTVSNPRRSLGEDSGWEENNVFQSGPDDTPPAKASRKSSRRGRLPDSPTAQASSSSPPKADKHDTTPAPLKPRRKVVLAPTEMDPPGSAISVIQSYSPSQSDSKRAEARAEAVDAENQDDSASEELRELSVDSRGAMTRHPKGSSSLRVLKWIVIAAALTTFGNSIYNYKAQSSSIGYCDAGTNSNRQLRALRAERQAIAECNAHLVQHGPEAPNTRLVNDKECPLEPFFPTPDYCTPCPKLAYCSGSEVKCKGAYILEKHPFAVAGFSPLFDGIPGFGPVAFPPTCIENRERIHEVGKLGRSILGYLSKIKGQLLCEGRGRRIKESEIKVLGLEKGQLRAVAKSWIRQIPLEEQDPLFDDALQKLESNGLVVTELDALGRTWIAGMREDMGLGCKVKVFFMDAWDEWRGYLYGFLSLTLLLVYGRHRLAIRHIESRQVAELVQSALDTLRDLEYAHHTDPVRAPHSFIAPVNLRDQVLRDIHSTRERKRIWTQVERIVEGNSNIRVNVQELNGEEIVVWRWIGATGISPHK